MRCIRFRLCWVIVLSIFLGACANKGIKKEEASVQSQEILDAEKKLQDQYQQAIQAMKSLESSSEKALEAGALKDNAELESIREALRKVHEKKPYYPGPILNLAISALWLGDVDESKSYFDQLLELQTKMDEAVVNKSLLQQEKEDISENLAKFTGSALSYLGQIHREQGNFEQAEKFYRQALAQNPEDKTAIRNLGILLDLYLGKLAEALPLYEQYQALLEEPDPQVKDWIFDLKNRL